jgi:hypothetical protein
MFHQPHPKTQASAQEDFMATTHVRDIRDQGGLRPITRNERLAWGVAALLGLTCIAFIILLSIWGWHGHYGPDTGVTVQQIEQHPDRFYGRSVTVSGVVHQVFDTREFTLGTANNGQLLVLTPRFSTQQEPFTRGEIAQVTGTIREFRRAQLERNLGVTLAEDHSQWEGKPVLIANQIALTKEPQGTATAQGKTPPPANPSGEMPPAAE